MIYEEVMKIAEKYQKEIVDPAIEELKTIIKSSKEREEKIMKINKKEISVITICPICGHVHEIAVNEADYFDWDDGMPAQDAFPYLSADEREMLISSICPECWAQTFGDDDEEDPEDWEDDVDECGYNPYMGCYDFDC